MEEVILGRIINEMSNQKNLEIEQQFEGILSWFKSAIISKACMVLKEDGWPYIEARIKLVKEERVV